MLYLDSLSNLLLVSTITYLVFDSGLTALFASLFLDIMKLQTLYEKVISCKYEIASSEPKQKLS